MSNFGYYLIALIVIVLGFMIVKKVTTCMFKATVGVIVLAILGILYWLYF